MLIAELAKRLEREEIVRAFGFLQAQYVGLPLDKQPFHERHAQANGIDVPGGDGERHSGSGSGSRNLGKPGREDKPYADHADARTSGAAATRQFFRFWFHSRFAR